ncbi:MAG: DNA polymerase domain-containing protein, partial [Nanoarchaeota archaeon]
KNEIMIAQLVKVPLSKTRSPNPIIDFLVLRKARKKGVHLPSKNFKVEKAHFEGGWVFDAVPGMYSDILIADFSSLYPSIIRNYNISPDSLLSSDYTGECITTPLGFKFSKTTGILTEILDELTDLRLKYKRERREAKDAGNLILEKEKELKDLSTKVVILSAYGIFASAYFRWFNLDIARNITMTGQALIKHVAKRLNESRYNVIYGDTDSVMISTNGYENLDKIRNIVDSAILEKYKESNSNRANNLKMEFEKFASKFVLLSKKKYIMKVDAE